jgi:uncharacterized protein YyaL (SSP411 family)
MAVADPSDNESTAKIPLLAGRPQLEGLATAYVCERFACQAPTTAPEELARQLA